MAKYSHLPIWKTGMSLAVHLENAIRRFPRYHKYTLGSDLRHKALTICTLVARANSAHGVKRFQTLEELVYSVEEIKTLVQLAREVQAWANQNEFLQATEYVVDIGKQAASWHRSSGSGAG